MKFLNIILFLIIIYISYLLIFKRTHEGFNNYQSEEKRIQKNKKVKKKNRKKNNRKNKEKKNYNTKIKRNNQDNNYLFVETQFHTDYRDTITAFNNLSQQKELFNPSNLPIEEDTHIKLEEIETLVNNFIDELNNNIKNSVPEFRNKNTGWDEVIEDKNVESGWARHMRQLGLPPSIYNDSARKAKIELIDIDHYKKVETKDEIRYIVYLFIKKENVDDQLLVKISFLIRKDDVNIDRNFFKDTDIAIERPVIIETIFVIGYKSFSTI